MGLFTDSISDEEFEKNLEKYNAGFSDEQLVINVLAEKYGYSRRVIREAVQSPMAFIFKTINEIPNDFEGPFPEFHISRFGKFIPKWKYSINAFKEKENEHKTI